MSQTSTSCGEPTISPSQHEINYTPSKWSKRYKDEELLVRFFDFCGRITENVRKSVKCELNVPYDSTERTKYDIYGTDLPEDAPIFVFIHGGYWQECSKDIAGFAVPAFVESGIKVIAIGYDLCPNVRIGNIVAEIKSAVEKILKSASTSGCRHVWIAGHSAGAHLAASLLHDRPWLNNLKQEGYYEMMKGILLIGGVYNLQPLLTTSFNAALNLSDQEVATYSFSKINTNGCTPINGIKVIVTVGECDSPIFLNESREYVGKLVTFVDNVEYILLRDNTDHFDIVEKLVEKKYALTKILLKALKDP